MLQQVVKRHDERRIYRPQDIHRRISFDGQVDIYGINCSGVADCSALMALRVRSRGRLLCPGSAGKK